MHYSEMHLDPSKKSGKDSGWKTNSLKFLAHRVWMHPFFSLVLCLPFLAVYLSFLSLYSLVCASLFEHFYCGYLSLYVLKHSSTMLTLTLSDTKVLQVLVLVLALY